MKLTKKQEVILFENHIDKKYPYFYIMVLILEMLWVLGAITSAILIWFVTWWWKLTLSCFVFGLLFSLFIKYFYIYQLRRFNV